jgi:hypothetical protein
MVTLLTTITRRKHSRALIERTSLRWQGHAEHVSNAAITRFDFHPDPVAWFDPSYASFVSRPVLRVHRKRSPLRVPVGDPGNDPRVVHDDANRGEFIPPKHVVTVGGSSTQAKRKRRFITVGVARWGPYHGRFDPVFLRQWDRMLLSPTDAVVRIEHLPGLSFVSRGV